MQFFFSQGDQIIKIIIPVKSISQDKFKGLYTYLFGELPIGEGQKYKVDNNLKYFYY